ncbi:carbohydrate esterase family 3 protein [Hypoxylon crocopeplum]|nr:carbohydrate esterase family 3 protein [Hypoxylon crocopeplum]
MSTYKHLLWCILACTSHLVNGLALPKLVALDDNGVLPRESDEARAKGFANRLPLRIMPLGASITYGYGSSDGNGYRKYLRDQLENNGNEINMVGSKTAGNMTDNDTEGWSGYIVDTVHDKAKVAVPKLKPNIILINAGTNDCIANNHLPNAGDRVTNMLNDLYKESPKATIILSTLLLNHNPDVEKRVEDFNSQLKIVASEFQLTGKRLVLVDMQGDNGPKLEDLNKDGTHPNDAGYKKMAQIWFDGIKEADERLYLQKAEKVDGIQDDGAPSSRKMRHAAHRRPVEGNKQTIKCRDNGKPPSKRTNPEVQRRFPGEPEHVDGPQGDVVALFKGINGAM